MKVITLSIVSHGHGEYVQRLLGDLERQNSTEYFKVILIINKIEEEIDVSRFKGLEIQIIKNLRPRGFGSNHNRAFEVSSTPWFAIVNPDVRLDDSCSVSKIIDSLSSDRVFLSPRVIDKWGNIVDFLRPNLSPFSILRRLRLGRGSAVSKALDGQLRFQWLAGIFLVVRQDVFRKIGGFDERFFLYCEDYDLSARVYVGGYRSGVIDNVSVVHDAQRDSHRSWQHLIWHMSGLLRVWLSRPFFQVLWADMFSRNR